MPAFKQVASAFSNYDLQASQNEFNRRKKVLCVHDEYIRFELDVVIYPELSVEKLERIISELHIRNVLKSDDIVKAAQYDYMIECLRLYVINPTLPPVPENTNAPEEDVTL